MFDNVDWLMCGAVNGWMFCLPIQLADGMKHTWSMQSAEMDEPYVNMLTLPVTDTIQ